MKNYYILGTSDSSTKNAYSILMKRLDEKKYPLYTRTPHLHRIQDNDAVVFYLAGKKDKAQNFLAESVISSVETSNELLIDPDKERYVVEKYLILDKIKIFKAPIHIKSIITKLDFIVNKSNYGVYLMGGVKKISENDYKLIAY